MKKKFTAWVLSIFAIAGALSANAQPVPQALEGLFRLEGRWDGDATLNLSGAVFNFIYTVDFKRNEESSGMTMEETFTHPDLGTLKGYNLIGYNANDDKIHWFSVDNFGTAHDHLGYWITNNHFLMTVKEKQGSKKYEEVIHIYFNSPTNISISLVATLGNTVVETLSGTFNKVSGKNSPVPSSDLSSKKLENDQSPLIKLYPNPTSGIIHIEMKTPGNLDLNLVIYDASGKLIRQERIPRGNSDFSLSGMLAGVYHFQLYNGRQSLQSGSFIVQ